MYKIVMLSKTSKEYKGYDYEREEFAKNDAEFIIASCSNEEEAIDAVKDADVILFSDISINGKIIKSLNHCKLIIRYGIGYDNIDLDAATKKGIMVCNSPNYGVYDVGEHTLSLILACCKRIVYMDDCVRRGMWDVKNMGKSHRLAGKTIGFIGFGRIARCVCKRTNAFEMKPIVYDPYIEKACLNEYNARNVSFDELLDKSDYITLHLPLNDGTKHILGKEEFKKMKKSVIIINTSRGGLINEPELIDALETGEVAGAGLDVFETESDQIDKRILNMKNVVLTPHIAWNTFEGVTSLHKEVTDNVLRFLRGERPVNIVNHII